MSEGASGYTPAQVASIYSACTTDDYAALPGAVIIIYDHMLTIGDELKLISYSHSSTAAILYFVNRIVSILYAVGVILLPLLWQSEASEEAVQIFCSIPQLIMFFIWAVFSALRVYAVLQRSWVAAVVVFGICILPFAINLYLISEIEFHDVGRSWIYTYKASATLSLLGIAVRVCAIASDIAVLVCTWVGVYRLGGPLCGRNSTPLTVLLLRNGSVQFVFLLVLNAILLIIYSTSQSVYIQLGPLVLALSSVIVSRFTLDLREMHVALAYGSQTRGSTLSPDPDPIFRRPEGMPSTRANTSFFGHLGIVEESWMCGDVSAERSEEIELGKEGCSGVKLEDGV